MGTTAHQLKLTSVHEAGHAVASWYVGLKFKYVTIVADGDTRGHIKHRKIRWPRSGLYFAAAARDRAERTILWLFAGQLAERRLRPRSRWRIAGATDLATAAALFGRICDVDDQCQRLHLRLLWRRAEAFVESHWRHIKAVALELRVLRRLSYDYVLRTIDRVDRQMWRAGRTALAQRTAGGTAR